MSSKPRIKPADAEDGRPVSISARLGRLQFHYSGKFRVLQIADIQDGPKVSKDTITLIEASLDATRPDLVIFSGNQIAGYDPAFADSFRKRRWCDEPIAESALNHTRALVRKAIARPRPYTALGFTPLFPKDKAGQSMPSRHCFSAAAIAGAAWYVFQPWGLALAVLAVVIAVCRVVTGVHYVSDVLAGLAFGTVFSVLGWNAFVLAASALGFYAIMLL